MNDLKAFDYEGMNVRVITHDGNPLFVASDICRALDITNSRDAVARLDEDEKGVVLTDTLGGPQNLTVVNEAGLYMLILSSRKPGAKQFKRWITHEVIPSIRKYGVYAVDDVLSNPDMLISALEALKAERSVKKALELENQIQRQQIAEMHPKASYYDKVLACPDLVKITIIAKDYGWSAIRMNQELEKRKIQFKQGDTWFLYQKYAIKGYTQSKTYTYTGDSGMEHAKMHTLWTQSGRLFIYDILKADGILPVCERECA